MSEEDDTVRRACDILTDVIHSTEALSPQSLRLAVTGGEIDTQTNEYTTNLTVQEAWQYAKDYGPPILTMLNILKISYDIWKAAQPKPPSLEEKITYLLEKLFEMRPEARRLDTDKLKAAAEQVAAPRLEP
jgi:hypothetical protein